MTEGLGTAELRPTQVEMNGINVISESERKGHPRDLFWPWFAANISVLGLSYGSFELGFGISFWQALIVGVVGIVLSFLACGFIALAGKRGSAPTMVLSRAAFGFNGNKLPAVISWLLTVGLGDRARHPGHAGHRDRVHPAGLGRRHRHRGGRADRGGGPDHLRRRDGIRPDHAACRPGSPS